jgi:hypothetical protein
LGQLPFFAEFLEVSGLFARWRDGCPMAYSSPNAPEVVDVLGTWLLSILDGQRRYAHVAGLRGDEVAPQILGMNKIISDESLRRALAHLAPNQPKRCSDEERAARTAQLAKSTAWMDTALSESSREALRTPWILDTDSTVKVLYGHQAGAEIGYNPTKPGRPSHTLTPTGSASCVWYSISRCKAAKPMPQNIACPVCAGCLSGSLLKNVRSWCAATTPLVTRA